MASPADYPQLLPYLTTIIVSQNAGYDDNGDILPSEKHVFDGCLIDPYAGVYSGQYADVMLARNQPYIISAWCPHGVEKVATIRCEVEVVEKLDDDGNVIVRGGQYTMFNELKVSPLGVELTLRGDSV